jgi:hypothetical protein
MKKYQGRVPFLRSSGQLDCSAPTGEYISKGGSLNATYLAAALAPHSRRSRSGSFAHSRCVRLEFCHIRTTIDYWESDFGFGFGVGVG